MRILTNSITAVTPVKRRLKPCGFPWTAVVIGACLLATPEAASAQSWVAAEPACHTLTLAAAGGAIPKDPSVLVLRWLGASNLELAYRDSVILLNAFYQRTPPARPLGFSRDDIKRADAIFIGHGHGDHMADAPYVAQRLGAPLIGGPPTADLARKAGVAERQIVAVKDGWVKNYNGFSVEAILARHLQRPPDFNRATGEAYRAVLAASGLARTAEQERQVREQNVIPNDPRIIAEGSFAYLLTFGSGYTLMMIDSNGPVTESERRVMQRIGGRTNMLVGAHAAVVPQFQRDETLPLVKLFKPDVYMPIHHDDVGGGRLDTPLVPWFMDIRDGLPDTRSIAPLYRTPVCVNTQTTEVFVGR